MSELMRLIQAHLDRYGVTRAEFARRAGTKPQTVHNWSNKGTLPRAEVLHGVAEIIDAPYLMVLDAALVDAGYRDSLVDDVKVLESRIGRLAQADPAAVHRIAVFVADLERELGEGREAMPTAELIAELLRRGGDSGYRSAPTPDL